MINTAKIDAEVDEYEAMEREARLNLSRVSLRNVWHWHDHLACVLCGRCVGPVPMSPG